MSVEKNKTLRILLIALSLLLFVSVIGKLAVTLMGAYGGSLFITLDNISSSLLVIWLITMMLHIRPVQNQ